MRAEVFLDGRVTLYCGDCLDVLPTLDADSFDSCVTDPPYHLTSVAVAWDTMPANRGKPQITKKSVGFMGQAWDGGDIAFRPDVWREVYRVLKPGAHLLAFGGTRTYHRMACAVEDAGFEIRDCVQWLYGSGFPKSRDVSKAIDSEAGAERDVLSRTPTKVGVFAHSGNGMVQNIEDYEHVITAPATAAARAWEGFGTALKPACELIVLARKPLSEGTVAANVLKWGTGALNIDGCRVEHVTVDGGSLATNPHLRASINGGNGGKIFPTETDRRVVTPNQFGRWPANVIHDGSEEVVAGFPETAPSIDAVRVNKAITQFGFGDGKPNGRLSTGHSDTGSAARFFYSARPDEPSADRRYTNDGATNFSALPGARRDAVSPSRLFYSSKADADDRLGSKHPTVKPVGLKQYLVRLICPPGGIVLDCFAGTGTTGEACIREGFRAILIEREAEYQDDIRRRMRLALGSARERSHESVKAKQKHKPVDHGPLFGGAAE